MVASRQNFEFIEFYFNITFQDPFLKNILNDLPNIISGILEHDSLLEHKEEEELHDLEKSNAWTSYNHNECGSKPLNYV